MPKNETAGFNLAQLDTISACNKPFEFEIRSVTGMPTGFFISVLGKDSDEYRSIVRNLADEGLRKQATGKATPETLDKLEARNIEALAAVTVGWRFLEDKAVPFGEELLEFSRENARRIYTALLPVREQVTEAINNLENFISA